MNIHTAEEVIDSLQISLSFVPQCAKSMARRSEPAASGENITYGPLAALIARLAANASAPITESARKAQTLGRLIELRAARITKGGEKKCWSVAFELCVCARLAALQPRGGVALTKSELAIMIDSAHSFPPTNCELIP